MNINPNAVASARTARLAREAATPVYSTKTGDRPRPAVRRPGPVEPDHCGCVHSIGYCSER